MNHTVAIALRDRRGQILDPDEGALITRAPQAQGNDLPEREPPKKEPH